MSIPFPIEDEEAAKVVERASRGEHRHVLVLTERPILTESEASSPNGVSHEESELRALLADAISEAAAHGAIDGEPEWIPDPEPEPQEYELCGVGVIAEIGHNHQGSVEKARELFREAGIKVDSVATLVDKLKNEAGVL